MERRYNRFFSERDITNIDGLVNNNVAQYIKNDDLNYLPYKK